MMFNVGQGIFGRVQFKDGKNPEYDRPYLIIEIHEDQIGILVVSSAAGKSYRLLNVSSTMLINKHYPPFRRKSFVKLDSLTYILISYAQSMKLLDNGSVLDGAEIRKIQKAIATIEY